jgi:hypothetical protein
MFMNSLNKKIAGLALVGVFVFTFGLSYSLMNGLQETNNQVAATRGIAPVTVRPSPSPSVSPTNSPLPSPTTCSKSTEIVAGAIINDLNKIEDIESKIQKIQNDLATAIKGFEANVSDTDAQKARKISAVTRIAQKNIEILKKQLSEAEKQLAADEKQLDACTRIDPEGEASPTPNPSQSPTPTSNPNYPYSSPNPNSSPSPSQTPAN